MISEPLPPLTADGSPAAAAELAVSDGLQVLEPSELDALLVPAGDDDDPALAGEPWLPPHYPYAYPGYDGEPPGEPVGDCNCSASVSRRLDLPAERVRRSRRGAIRRTKTIGPGPEFVTELRYRPAAGQAQARRFAIARGLAEVTVAVSCQPKGCGGNCTATVELNAAYQGLVVTSASNRGNDRGVAEQGMACRFQVDAAQVFQNGIAVASGTPKAGLQYVDVGRRPNRTRVRGLVKPAFAAFPLNARDGILIQVPAGAKTVARLDAGARGRVTANGLAMAASQAITLAWAIFGAVRASNCPGIGPSTFLLVGGRDARAQVALEGEIRRSFMRQGLPAPQSLSSP